MNCRFIDLVRSPNLSMADARNGKGLCTSYVTTHEFGKPFFRLVELNKIDGHSETVVAHATDT